MNIYTSIKTLKTWRSGHKVVKYLNNYAWIHKEKMSTIEALSFQLYTELSTVSTEHSTLSKTLNIRQSLG